MTRKRTSIFVPGVCIGTFLLLFSCVVAEVTEPYTVTSEMSGSQKASTPQRITTVLTIAPSTYQTKSISEKDEIGTDETSKKANDKKNETHDDISNDKDTDQDGDKSDISSSRKSHDTISHAARSNEETEKSSEGNRNPRYGEIVVGNSGKSGSAKVISEDILRLSRTNELTKATPKPALNDSKHDNEKSIENGTLQEASNYETITNTNKIILPSAKENIINNKLIVNITKTSDSKYKEIIPRNSTVLESSISEEKKNATENRKEEIKTSRSIGESSSVTSLQMTFEDVVKNDEKGDKNTKSDHKEVISKIESKIDKNNTLLNLEYKGKDEEDDQLQNRNQELTTIRDAQHKDSDNVKKNTDGLGTTASEVLDLERIDEREHEGTISLINDTYVNYNHFYKTLMERNPKGAPGNHSINVNPNSSGMTRGKGDPKEEIEVVKNVTHQPILKIVATTDDTAKNDTIFNELGSEKEETSAKNEQNREKKIASSVSNATTETADGAEERKSIGEPESQIKLPEATTESIRLEEQTSSTSEIVPSPVLQGRTIEFSGVNEFPSIELKSTASTKTVNGSGTISVTQDPQKSFNAEKMDQKPYPYLKSSKETLQVTTETGSRVKNESGDVTAETSAYENTIGRRESDKKSVVTEPSVVIENSIQQQKSDEKNVNGSTSSTTESHSLMPATVIPIISGVVPPTNKTLPERFHNGTKAAGAKSSGSNENNTLGTKGEEKVIANIDEGYDMTGNGITEVSLIPEMDGRDDKKVKSHSGETTKSSTLNSTESLKASKVRLFNTDIQTEPEEAMMIRSSLIVTESTLMPKVVAAEVNKSTTSMASSIEISTIPAAKVFENLTEPISKMNLTLQSFSNANETTEFSTATLNPDETSIPTTTSIEYEFIGLTETVSLGGNTTEKNVESRTFEEQSMSSNTTIQPIIQVPFMRNNLTEDAVTTMKPDAFTNESPTTTEDETLTTNQVSTVENATTELGDSPVTHFPIEEPTNRTYFTRNKVTASAIDFTGTVGDITEVIGNAEDLLKSKNSSLDVNVTENSTSDTTEVSPNLGVTTLPTAMLNSTKHPLPTFTASTLEPRVLWSIPEFTDAPEEETTETMHTLSPDEITLLVKIIIEGTLHEVCPRLQDLRKALADVLTSGMDKLVLSKQVVIHQNPCPGSANSSPTPVDVSLTSILVYVVDEDGKFDAAMTKILPSLYKVSANFPVRIHKFLLVQETDSGNAIAVVVVSSVAFICLVLLAGLLFIMRKRQTRFNYGERCRPVSLDAYSLDSVSAYNSVRRKGAARSSKRSYGNPTFEDSSAIPSHPLNFAGLSSFCNDVNAINEEFAGIPQVSAKIDELPPGAEVKNRYANVIPLPETRVPLQKLNNDALTEYINASYVRGPKNATKYYIACQAPVESTVTDFWRMIWEQQCKVIIMLTDLVENGVEKCTEYIPPSEVTDCHRLYGDFQVTLKKRETKEKYAISTLHLKNLENNTFREVFHIWYLWPVSGVQSDGAGLIAVLLEARALQRGGPGPIVVHCSPGTGRTGTLIALDLGIRQYEITRTVDVPRVVYTIRRDRAGAVQTKEQYAFIYKALNLYATKLAGGILEST